MGKKKYYYEKAPNIPDFPSSFWYSRLYSIYTNIFRFEGFPFPEDVYKDCINYMLFCLYNTGQFAIGRNSGGIPAGGTVAGVGGLTWFNTYAEYTITNVIESFNCKREDMALCYLTNSKLPFSYFLNYYAKLLISIDKTIEVNLNGQKTPAILRAKEGQEASTQLAYSKVAGFEPVVLGYNNLLDSTNGVIAYQPPAEYNADKLEMLKHDILNDYFQIFGVTSKPVEKRTVVLEDELTADEDALEICKETFLDCFRDFAKQVNKVFGGNARVSINKKVMEEEENNVQLQQ